MNNSSDRIALLQTFIRIADAGSISAAARDLGLSQPSVSRRLAALEAGLKTQLMRRSTHSLALTDSGAELLADARQVVDGWEALAEKYLSAETGIHGRIKVVAPVALGQEFLVRKVCEFQARYPGVRLTWALEDHPIRFTEIGCDCWIKVGPVPDDRLIVRRLGSVERLLVASEGFISQYGLPKTPRAAERLPLIALDPFEGGKVTLIRNNRSIGIAPTVRMNTNNIFALKEAARLGVGMAVLPTWFIAEELRSGALMNMVPGWFAPSFDIHIAYLPGRHQPLRLRTFIDWIEKTVPEIEGIKAV